MTEKTVYRPKHPIRFVTATSLFDGHDVSINIFRQMLQAAGVEVVHLGHNRSVPEIVTCALQEDVQAVALSSYQGGHMETFKYLYDALSERDCRHIRIFGGGGGVFLPEEIRELHEYGITRIYSPEDGRRMGLQGIINDMIEQSDFSTIANFSINTANLSIRDIRETGRAISYIENTGNLPAESDTDKTPACERPPIIGITGTGGSGKSTLTDEILRRYCTDFPDQNIAVVSVDPTRRKTGGALLGDRIRMNTLGHVNIFMRSMALRDSARSISRHITAVINTLQSVGYDLIILESSGISQADSDIVDHCDFSILVMTPEYGASTQLEKIDMLDFADVILLNKSDKQGALDALNDIRKAYAYRKNIPIDQIDSLPVFETIASSFNHPGVNRFYHHLIQRIHGHDPAAPKLTHTVPASPQDSLELIPAGRSQYLAEISETIKTYNLRTTDQCDIASRLYTLNHAISEMENRGETRAVESLRDIIHELEQTLDPDHQNALSSWNEKKSQYRNHEFVYTVRDREFRIRNFSETLSRLTIPKVALPAYRDWGDILRWILQENVPGEFPFTAGVFPFKRENEDPIRMFAGEGSPERTNKRFHYISRGMSAKRLSTAFDSPTLYGRDPNTQPDIFGKIGNAGVSVCCLDDMKKLYSGFNLAAPDTSVSMTINGPAPILIAFFFNTAIDQQCEIYIRNNGLEDRVQKTIQKLYRNDGHERPAYCEDLPRGNDGLGLMLLGITGDRVLPRETYERIKMDTLSRIRGTVQADILKEDQAQNTCIYSIDFSMKLIGDVQQYFIQNRVRNFYSLSVSGYHIAEAGANPITQLAFTLANGFTYVEYFLARGMDINDFAPNLSFFFSSGLDPEYTVLGRVARRIWAKAMKFRYQADVRSQKLKYHIQTSGRSLHAQEIDFNDIRTCLQALQAIYDNCNSLHTNSYDEAITTPTEESVRRAIAIQMIINKELGLAKNQNSLQGSFIVEELTDLVEEAVLHEFESLSRRGGVLGAMERTYQRSKIQDESMIYEIRKENGDLPVIGVNTFLSCTESTSLPPNQVSRATEAEKKQQITTVANLNETFSEQSHEHLKQLKNAAADNRDIFAVLMETVKHCSLGTISETLFEQGGQYRRNM